MNFIEVGTGGTAAVLGEFETQFAIILTHMESKVRFWALLTLPVFLHSPIVLFNKKADCSHGMQRRVLQRKAR